MGFRVRRWACAAALAAAGILVSQTAAADGYGFTVDVTLSPKAAALLAARKEKIVVAAYYDGDVRPDYRAKADDLGHIDLGKELVTISGAGGRAVFTGKTLLKARLGWVTEARIVINVFTARLSGQYNLISCGFVEGTFPKMQARPVAIHCKLIKGE